MLDNLDLQKIINLSCHTVNPYFSVQCKRISKCKHKIMIFANKKPYEKKQTGKLRALIVTSINS